MPPWALSRMIAQANRAGPPPGPFATRLATLPVSYPCILRNKSKCATSQRRGGSIPRCGSPYLPATGPTQNLSASTRQETAGSERESAASGGCHPSRSGYAYGGNSARRGKGLERSIAPSPSRLESSLWQAERQGRRYRPLAQRAHAASLATIRVRQPASRSTSLVDAASTAA